MPSREELAATKRADDLELSLSSSRILHVRTRLLIYKRGEDDGPELIEERRDLDLLLDPLTQVRKLRHESSDPEAWDAWAAEYATLIDIPITAHEAQVEAIIDDTSKVIGVFGGNRAGKTECLAWWIFRKWILTGGHGKRFWWISPNWKQTRIGIQKLCIRRRDLPPIIPARLRTAFPANERSVDQAIVMIDGSRIELHHGSSDGDNLKGYDIEAAAFDELTAIARIENWRIGKARTMDSGGQVACASTPKQGHWARTEIVARARQTTDVSHVELTCFDNPWMNTAEIWRLIKSEGGEKDPTVRREYFGEWVADGNALWPDWMPEEHLRTGDDVRGCVDLGLTDITAQVARGFFETGSAHTHVGGQDFNVDPMTTMVCQIFGNPSNPDTWGLLVLDEVQTRGNVYAHAENLAKLYPGLPISCDATGCLPGTHPSQGAKGSGTNAKILRASGFDARACHKRRGKPNNPRVIDSLNLMHRLFRAGRIIVHSRCKALIVALDTQESRPDGSIAKDPGTYSDRLSSPTDALRYLAWSLFAKRELRRDAPIQ